MSKQINGVKISLWPFLLIYKSRVERKLIIMTSGWESCGQASRPSLLST